MQDTLNFLRTRLPPLTLAEAIPPLRTEWEQQALLACYLHFFPKEFARTQARLERDPLREAYSPAELEFLRLVDTQLFPIPYLIDEDFTALDPEERQWAIPIVPCGRDWYDEDVIEPGWQVLLLLAGYALNCFGLTLQQQPDFEQLLAVVQEAQDKMTWLLQRAASAPAPLSSLPLALKVIQLTTDTLWLDTTPEQPAEGLLWCIDNVELLRCEWEASEQITARVNELAEWLGVAPLARLRELVLCLLKW
jgi:hypothetical protein